MNKSNKLQLLVILIILVILLILLIIIINIRNSSSYINDTKALDNQVAEEIKTIPKRYEYNQFYYQKLTTSSLVNIYLNDYINTIIEDVEESYNLLQKEYRDKRFGDYKSYKEFVDERIELLKSAKVDKYYESRYDEYIQYIIIDQYGNYYIFHVTAVLQYNVLLDTYTIPIQENKKKYMNEDDTVKASMHVQTFIEMINTKDYTAAYNVLAQGFKQNYFKDETTFKKFVKSLFFECNKIKSATVQNKDNYYVITVTIQDYKDLNKELKPINFIVNIKDDMQFELSFGS